MGRKIIDLLFTYKTPNIDQVDIFVFSIVVLEEMFDSSLQIPGTESSYHKHCHIFLPDFFRWWKSAKNKIFVEDHFEA